jgi:hypothetical protein
LTDFLISIAHASALISEIQTEHRLRESIRLIFALE